MSPADQMSTFVVYDVQPMTSSGALEYIENHLFSIEPQLCTVNATFLVKWND